MITIVDYGMGNLRSVQKAFEFLGYEAGLSSSQDELLSADGLVLPGVGAFKKAMENLRRQGLIGPLRSFLSSGKPFLGICLGLHLLFERSDEGEDEGLSIIRGRVIRFGEGVKTPHIGWNSLKIRKDGCPLMEGIDDGSYFYFVHSYYVIPEDEDIVVATSDYGSEFAAVIWLDNIYAVQFHPEKSQRLGLKLLDNFGRVVARCS